MPDLAALRARRAELRAKFLGGLATAADVVEWLRISRDVSRWARACDPADLHDEDEGDAMADATDARGRRKCAECGQYRPDVRHTGNEGASLCRDCWARRPGDRSTGMPGRECGGK